jgi:squalene-hopene/tetraprenyl-beta-curcumene cyclase
MKAGLHLTEALLTGVALAGMLACSHSPARISTSWDPKAAASYLDYRENWWAGWTGSARDHGTYCVSCHTALPYALARPTLRAELAEPGPSSTEQSLVQNVTKRVRLWKDIGPYYSDQKYIGKTEESRGTEAVLNALILAKYDAGRGELSEDTRAAFEDMWALQQNAGKNAGAWHWLQFDEEPWRESWSQSTINRIFLLWASTKLSGLLNAEEQKAIVKEVLSRQQADGGWRLASIAWSWNAWSPRSLFQVWFREDGTPMEGRSDGLATGLITLVLQEYGVPGSNPQLQRGLVWLMSNQATEGSWPALSINKKRNPSSDTGRFMSDAATAFAVLSLAENQGKRSPQVSALNP